MRGGQLDDVHRAMNQLVVGVANLDRGVARFDHPLSDHAEQPVLGAAGDFFFAALQGGLGLPQLLVAHLALLTSLGQPLQFLRLPLVELFQVTVGPHHQPGAGRDGDGDFGRLRKFDLQRAGAGRGHLGHLPGGGFQPSHLRQRQRQHDEHAGHHHKALHDVGPDHGVKTAVGGVNDHRHREHHQADQVLGINTLDQLHAG